jgi:hypothetical protein
VDTQGVAPDVAKLAPLRAYGSGISDSLARPTNLTVLSVWPMARDLCTYMSRATYRNTSLCALQQGTTPCGADGGGGLFVDLTPALNATLTNSAALTAATLLFHATITNGYHAPRPPRK